MRRVVTNESESPNPSTSGFLNKLRHLVNSPETDHLIAWSPSGDSFHVFDGPKLAQKVLPIYFKHNNLSSFVRQLNMYGFRKVNRPETGLARMNSNDLQFTHPSFIRDMPHLMKNIQRRNNISSHRNGSSTELVPNTSLDLYRREDDDEISRRDFRRMLDTINEMKQAQQCTDCKVNVLRQENEILLKRVECLVETCQRNSTVIQQLMNMFVPIIGNGEQRIHNILGSVKRQITASGEETANTTPAFRSFDDVKLHLMNSSGLNVDPASSSNLDGPRPSKVRRGLVGATSGLTSQTPVNNFPPTTTVHDAGLNNNNSGLVIEEVRDDPPVRKVNPASTYKRPLRIIMPSVKTKAPNNGAVWNGNGDVPGPSNGAHNMAVMPDLGLTLFPQLENQGNEKKPATELVPSSSHQPLLRTPSFNFNLPERMEDLFGSMNESSLPNINFEFDKAVPSNANDNQLSQQHIVGNELIPANIFNDESIFNTVKMNTPNPDIDSMLTYDDQQTSGNEDSNLTTAETEALAELFGDSNEGLDSQSPGLISPLGIESPGNVGNGSSSPPLLAPSAPKYSSVSVVSNSMVDASKSPLPEHCDDFTYSVH